jgi:hypothetical protein
MYGDGMPSKEDLIRRANATWLQRVKHSPYGYPTMSATTVEEHGGLTYVVLRRGDQVIDIYRYKPATEGWRDTLKLLRYWPSPYARNGGRRVAA